jgi:predicted transcriptional regulator
MANLSKERKERGQGKKFLAFKLELREKTIWDFACSVSHHSGIFRSDARDIAAEHKTSKNTIYKIIKSLVKKGFLLETKASTYTRGRGSRTATEYRVLTLSEWITANPKQYQLDLTALADHQSQYAAKRAAENEANCIRYQKSKSKKKGKSPSQLGTGIVPNKDGYCPKSDRVLSQNEPIQILEPFSESEEPAGSLVSGSLNSKPETGNLNFTELNSTKKVKSTSDKSKRKESNQNLDFSLSSDKGESNVVKTVPSQDGLPSAKQKTLVIDKGKTQIEEVVPSQEGLYLTSEKAKASEKVQVPPAAVADPAEIPSASSIGATESEVFTLPESEDGFDYGPAPEGWVEAGLPWPFKKRNPPERICQLCPKQAKGETDLCLDHLRWRKKAKVFQDKTKPEVQPEQSPTPEQQINLERDAHLLALTTLEPALILALLIHKLWVENGAKWFPEDWESQWTADLRPLLTKYTLSECLPMILATQKYYTTNFSNPGVYTDGDLSYGFQHQEKVKELLDPQVYTLEFQQGWI